MKKNNYIYITTQEELNKHLNELIVCYYYTDHYKELNDEFFDPDNKKRIIQYKWMFIFKGINDNQRSPTSIRHIILNSLNAIQLHSMDSNEPKIIYKNRTITEASAQHYIRLATKEEKLIYIKLMRKRRIYGHD